MNRMILKGFELVKPAGQTHLTSGKDHGFQMFSNARAEQAPPLRQGMNRISKF